MRSLPKGPLSAKDGGSGLSFGEQARCESTKKKWMFPKIGPKMDGL